MIPDTVRDKIRQYTYYIIIFTLSLISLTFLPMLGSTIGVVAAFPTEPIGWAVWAITRAIISTINVVIFISFMKQAEINVAENTRYKEAKEMLRRHKPHEYIPQSPAKWKLKQYGAKGTTVFLTSIASTVVLTQAVLTYDWVSALVYLFTIVGGIICGIMQMKKAELYWTEEFYDYAVWQGEKNNGKIEQ